MPTPSRPAAAGIVLGLARGIVAAAVAAAAALPLAAQAPSEPPRRWHASVEASANLFFGATSQRLGAATSSLSRRDDAVETEASLQMRYGDSRDDAGVRTVTARSALGTLTLDLAPKGRWSPFLFGGAETSLEKRIASRVSGGAGGKWVAWRAPAGEASLSLALLGERTKPRAAVPALPTRTDARWSARVKATRKVQERLTLAHVTFYQPVTSDFGRYLVSSTSEAGYAVNRTLSVGLSLVDTYDSEARSRGARSNNDGQLLAGIRARF